VPAISPYREFAVAGGLLSYGTDVREAYRSAAAASCVAHPVLRSDA
jgi:hypothetical protein